MNATDFFRAAICASALALSACGGGDGGGPPPPPPPPPPATIGPAGGTVTGPNGAKVEIPAGALASDTAIQITQGGAGLPAGPANAITSGNIYSFTPHGQTFALPVTITVPIDPPPIAIPPGAIVKLFKTANGAAGPWQEVPGATRTGSLISGPVTSFSGAGAFFFNPPSPAVVGPAGGTVTGPNGAKVEIPAGALAVNTTIAVTASATTLALPAGVATVGPVYSFTPHGQTFAQAVTITVPVNAAQVPAGAAVKLHKTANGAAGPWQEVAGATRTGNLVSALVTSFSDVAPTVNNLTPADQSVIAPAPATFSVNAIGTPPFTYQWRKSDDGGMTFSDILGATSATYTTGATSVGADNGDQYTVLVFQDSDGNGVIDGPGGSGRIATLTVTAAVVLPTITTQPLNVSAAVGGNASFSVVATGTNLVYQWQKNGTPIASQTNASLNLTNVQAGDAASYTVVVSNLVNGVPVNSITSNAATLTVTTPTTGTWQQLGGALDVGPVGSGARDLFAAVALDLTGNPVVAWKGRVVGPGTSTNTILVKRWDGANWVQLGGNLMVTATGIASNAGFLSTPSIDVDPTTGQPVVAWAEAKTSGPCLTPTDVYVKRWDGTAWQLLGGALNVDAAACAVNPKLRVKGAGTPVVSWWESPNWTAAKQWNGSAWVTFGGQNYVSPQPTGAQDSFLTSLTLDSSDNPFVVYGVPGGPFASQGSGSGWALLGNGSPRTSPAPAFAWSAATDALGRLTVLLLTYDGAVPAPGIATTLRVRRIEAGAWVDFGGPVLTADRNTVPNRIALAIPYGTSNPIGAVEIGGPAGRPAGPLVQSFARWDGAAWQPLALNLSDPCELAVRANANTPSTVAPAVACVRSAGNEDIVVYRLVP